MFGLFRDWFSRWLFWRGSAEWRVVEAQWQRGNSRLLHDSSDVDTNLWSDRQMDRNVRQLHSTYTYSVIHVFSYCSIVGICNIVIRFHFCGYRPKWFSGEVSQMSKWWMVITRLCDLFPISNVNEHVCLSQYSLILACENGMPDMWQWIKREFIEGLWIPTVCELTVWLYTPRSYLFRPTPLIKLVTMSVRPSVRTCPPQNIFPIWTKFDI